MPFLSIVIPVYNAKDYIEECLNSILFQDTNGYEIILVNDASTDTSGMICDRYAALYKNIRAIHLQVNSGPGGARNIGLQYAKGEYIHFCDSDDYYINNSLSSVINRLEMKVPDVLIGQFICQPEKGAFVCNDIELESEMIEGKNTNDIVQYILSFPNLTCTPWRFVVKRDLLLENNIYFPEHCYSEDEEWFPKVLCSGEKYALLKTPFYCYRPRATGSITSSKTYMHSKSILLVILNLLEFLNDKQYLDIRKDFILARVNLLWGIFSTRCDTFTGTQRKELSNMISNQLDCFRILGEIPERKAFIDMISHYGLDEGFSLYCKKVVDQTLELVRGKEDHHIFIFPTGNNGESTARILGNKGYNIKCFLDNSISKDGCVIDKIPVKLPQVLTDMTKDELKNILVIVSVQRREVANIIHNQLKQYGVRDSCIVSRIY